MIDRSIKCIATKKENKYVIWIFFINKSYPRIKSPDKAGIRRRLFDSRTEAKANLAAVNVRNDSVVFDKIRCVICKWWLPSVDVGSIPSSKWINKYIL